MARAGQEGAVIVAVGGTGPGGIWVFLSGTGGCEQKSELV